MTKLENYLNKLNESDWNAAIEKLLPAIDEVDRNAVQIWFRFYPLELFRFISTADDQENTLRNLAIQGKHSLADQIDTSHHFLYSHRFWKSVKVAIEAEAVTFADEWIAIDEEIRQVATLIAEKLGVDRSLLVGITAVGMMTLVQVGAERLKAAAGIMIEASSLMSKKPLQIVAARAKDDSQGLLGFLKTVNKEFSITYNERLPDGRFHIMNDQEIASASAKDRSQDWKSKDERCWEGVVPVECLAASCGTCWIGILAGQEKLSEVARRERRQMKVFGYNQPPDEKPILRLACQARAFGNATIVIPPWNGVFGKKVYGNVEDLELEPVTSSAKALRETVREATAGGGDK